MKTVLIVHESAAFRAALRGKLNPAGFHCIEAGDALAGLQRAFEERPAVVIIDAALGGLDGGDMRDMLANERVTRPLPVLLCEEEIGLEETRDEARMRRGHRIAAHAEASRWQSVLHGLIDSAVKRNPVGDLSLVEGVGCDKLATVEASSPTPTPAPAIYVQLS